MSTATHILHIAHGHDDTAPCADYWLEEPQAANFIMQMQSPKCPFVFFEDEDGIRRMYAIQDIRFCEIRAVLPASEEPGSEDQPRPEAKVISIIDYVRGN